MFQKALCISLASIGLWTDGQPKVFIGLLIKTYKIVFLKLLVSVTMKNPEKTVFALTFTITIKEW